MKIIKARYDLILFFFFPFCLLSTCLYFYDPNQFANYASGNWLCTLLLLIIFFHPQAKIPLGLGAGRPKVKWIFSLFVTELVLNFTLWSFTKLISYDLMNKVAIVINLNHLSLVNGLFPWGFMALFAITLGYFIYLKQSMGLVSSVFKPLFNNSFNDSIGVAVDSYMRFITHCILVLILCLLSLAGILLLKNGLDLELATGLKFQVSFISCLLFLWISYPAWIKMLHELMYRKIPIAVILLGFALLLCLLYPILSWGVNLFTTLNPALNFEFAELSATHLAVYLVITVVFFGYALSAIAGAVIANISQGKTIRQILLTTVLCFLISGEIIYWVDAAYTRWQLSSLPAIAMLFCGLVIIVIMLGKQNITYFLRATLPTATPIKVRSSFRLLKIVPLAVISVLCGYFSLGTRVWSYLMVLGFLPPISLLLISFVAIGKVIFGYSRDHFSIARTK